LLLLTCAAFAAGPEYTPSGKLKFPEHYREWVYLTSGFDMSYNRDAQPNGEHVFDNVFVDPDAYKAFTVTGRWPDKTILVLEIRTGQSKGSINQGGSFQGKVGAVEVHVKDTARFKGGWAFFSFNGRSPGEIFPPSASCYSCHKQHGAVDTTFVQFYPTLQPIAQAKQTMSAETGK
jgi:hypothetical protein